MRNMRHLAYLIIGVLVGWTGQPAAWADPAAVGGPAPGFTLTDTDGTARSLSDFAGRWVVLEWSNDGCPFVRKHYGSGKMQRLQQTYTQRGVIWLTIVSSAPGKQGYVTGAQANAIRQQRGDHQTAMLLDPDGAVGRRYGAKTTPHMFIIDPTGVLVYAGAIDDTPSTDPADIATATNYVERVLEEADHDQTISISQTQSYGCSIKY